MAGYSNRHYGKREFKLRHPKVIVLHFTATDSYDVRLEHLRLQRARTWASCPGSAATT